MVKYYVFGPLIAPDYNEHKCLAGPFDIKQAAFEYAKSGLGSFRNWIVSGYDSAELTAGTTVKINLNKLKNRLNSTEN